MPILDNFLNPSVDPLYTDTPKSVPAPPAPDNSTQQKGIDWDEIHNSIANQPFQEADNVNTRAHTFDWEGTNADRYVNSQYLSSVGFKPDAGVFNEQNYAAAQPAMKAIWNTLAGGGANTWKGFSGQFMSWFDTIPAITHWDIGRPFQEDELNEINKKSVEEDNAFPVFQKNPDSLNWRSFGQTVKGLGVLPGAILEMGAEQIGIGMLTAASLGALTAPLEELELGKITASTQRLANIIDPVANLRKNYEALKASGTAADAWNMIKSSASVVGSGMERGGVSHIPGIGGIADFTANVLNPGRATSIAKTTINGFHAVYSDLRDMNLAINMGQSSAAGVYKNTLDTELNDYKNKYGTNATGEDRQNILDNAQRAAKTDGATNAVAALVLNKLSFNNILSSNKQLQKIIAEQGMDIAERIGINKTVDEAGNKLYLKTTGWESFKQSILSINVANMSAHGLSFGTQMSTMAAIDKASEAYYNAVYNHRNLSWADAVREGINDQFTTEGAKTFISGVLTGSIAMGLIGEKIGASIKQGIDWARDKVDKVGAEERQQRTTDTNVAAKEFIDRYNDALKNPINNQLIDVVLQKDFAENIASSAASGDKKIAQDSKSDATLRFLANSTKNGLLDLYTDHLKNTIADLTPEELFAKFYGKDEPFNQEMHDDLAKRLDTFFKQTYDMKKTHDNLMRKYPNPYNPYRHKKDSSEREASMADYNNYKECIALATYYKGLTMDYTERLNNILNDNGVSKGINNLGSFKNLPFTTVQALTDSSKLAREVQSMTEELHQSKGIGQTSGTEATQHLKELTDSLKILNDYASGLSEFQKAYKDAQNITDPDKRKSTVDDLTEKHKKELQPLLQELANLHLKNQGLDAITTEDLGKGMDKFMDYYKLTVDQQAATTFVNTILDPQGWGHYIGSMRNASEKLRKGQRETEMTTPPASGEANTKEFDGNLHGWNPKTKRWEPIIKGDVYDSTTGKWGSKSGGNPPDGTPEDPAEKARREAQKENLKKHFDQTQTALTKYKDDKQKTDEFIDEYEKGVQDAKDRINELQEAFSKGKINKETFDNKINAVHTFLTTVNDTLSRLKDQKTSLEKVVSTVAEYEQYSKHYSRALTVIDKTGYIKIGDEMKNAQDAKADLLTFIDQSKTRIKELDTSISKIENDYSDIKDNLDGLKWYNEILEALKGVKSREGYKKVLENILKTENNKLTKILKDKPDSTKSLLHITVESLLAKINKGEDIENELDNIFHEYTNTLLEKLENVTALEKHEQDLSKLDKQIEYLDVLNKTLNTGEIKTPPQIPNAIFPEHLDALENNDVDNFDETPEEAEKRNQLKHRDAREIPNMNFRTQQRSHQPEHFEVVGDIGDNNFSKENPLRIQIAKGENEDGSKWVKTHVLDAVKHKESIEDIEDFLKNSLDNQLTDHLNSDKDIKDFTNTHDADLEYNVTLKHYHNDELVTDAPGSVIWNNMVADTVIKVGTTHLYIVTKDNDTFGIIRTDLNENDMKVIITDADGNPIDKNNKKIDNPTKDNISYTSLVGESDKDKDFSILGGDLNNPEDPNVKYQLEEVKAILENPSYKSSAYIASMYGHSLDDEESVDDYIKNVVKPQLVEFRKLISTVRKAISEGKIVKIVPSGKLKGIIVTEPKTDGKPVKANLIGRLVDSSATKFNFKGDSFRHPNGQVITGLNFEGNRIRLITEDKTEYPIYSRTLQPEEKEILKKVFTKYFEYLSKGVNNLPTADLKHKQELDNFIDSWVYLRKPEALEKGMVDGEKQLEDLVRTKSDKLGKNRFWITATTIYRTFPSAEKGKVKIFKFKFKDAKPNEIEEALNTMINGNEEYPHELFFNPDKKSWNSDEKYSLTINGENLVNEPNYSTFVIKNNLLNTNVIEYGTKDAKGNVLPQVKSSGIHFDVNTSTNRNLIIEDSKEVKPTTDIEAKRADINNKLDTLANAQRLYDQDKITDTDLDRIETKLGGGKEYFQEQLEALEQQPDAKLVEQYDKQTGTTQTNDLSKMSYTDEQKQAIENVIKHLESNNHGWYLIQGKAGTGKTTIAQEIVKKFPNKNIQVAALSHKAKEVIAGKFTNSPAKKLGVNTIAALLGINLNIETGKFTIDKSRKIPPPITNADIVIIDEASMLNEQIIDLVNKMKPSLCKVVVLGDIGQLPPIRDEEDDYYTDNDIEMDAKSSVFRLPNKSLLTERIRQGEDSPILPYADQFWENSQKENPIQDPTTERKSIVTSKGALIFAESFGDVQEHVLELFKQAIKTNNPNLVKVVTYKNNTRQEINNYIHQQVFGERSAEFVNGDLIMFNDNFGKELKNSMEFQIQNVSESKVDKDGIKSVNVSVHLGENTFTIPVLLSDSKSDFNEKVSEMFEKARELKNEDYNAYIGALKKAWAYKDSYANIDYAYAITSHKSQGSTYDVVVVHEDDIQSVGPTSDRNKSESIYTALTRSKNIVVSINSSEGTDYSHQNDNLSDLNKQIEAAKKPSAKTPETETKEVVNDLTKGIVDNNITKQPPVPQEEAASGSDIDIINQFRNQEPNQKGDTTKLDELRKNKEKRKKDFDINTDC